MLPGVAQHQKLPGCRTCAPELGPTTILHPCHQMPASGPVWYMFFRCQHSCLAVNRFAQQKLLLSDVSGLATCNARDVKVWFMPWLTWATDLIFTSSSVAIPKDVHTNWTQHVPCAGLKSRVGLQGSQHRADDHSKHTWTSCSHCCNPCQSATAA